MSSRAPQRLIAALAAGALTVAATAIAQDAPTEEESYRQFAPGLLVRSVYSTRDRVAVDIWDVMVGPGKSSDTFTLPGAAVLEVKTGAGTLEHSGERSELRLGSTLAVPANSKFRLSNASKDQALVLRAIIVKPRPS
jgi:quercetin dioxygenase-like cupin family protein